jgi:HD-GYP domain-containing protein (c-di-GMP phosphodiesterase class II)
MPTGLGLEVADFNKGHYRIPIILISGLDELANQEQSLRQKYLNFNYISKPFKPTYLIEKIKDILQIPVCDFNDLNLYRLKASYYLDNFENVISDVYISLNKTKYIKYIAKEDIDRTRLESLVAKNITYVYVDKQVFYHFMNKRCEELSSKFIEVEKNDDVFHLTAETLVFLKDSLSPFSVSSEQIELVHVCVKKCVEKLATNNEISLLLSDFFAKQGYLVGHTMLLIHVGFLLANKSGFGSDIFLEKLVLAALFHDIVLQDDEQAQYLMKPNRQELRDHPNQACNYAEQFQLISDEVKYAIRDHHELPDGSGYPAGKNEQDLSQFSALFIVSLHVSHHLYFAASKHKDIPYILAQISYLKVGKFKEILSKLSDLL